MTSTKYKVVFSSQFMENHIAAAVLDGTNGFSAFQTQAGATVLLSIGGDSIFRASIERDGTRTGWTVEDLSPLLAPRYPAGVNLSARTFAASLNPSSGGLTLLLAVTVTEAQDSFDELWMLSGPAGADPSVWLANPAQITWTKLAYDATSPAVADIKVSSLRVTCLYLEMGLERTDPTLALATVLDPSAPTELRCFRLRVTPGSDPVWTYFPQEQDIGTETLRMVPGRTNWDASWGLYKLYLLNGTPSLTFMPTQGEYGQPDATILTVPEGASAVASLAYQPYQTTAYTDLFVAANGFIGYFPYDQPRPHEAVRLITSPLLQGVTQLHAVNVKDTVVLWGLNGSGQVFYTKAPLDRRADPSAWQPPVALLSGTKTTAPLMGGATDALTLFAVCPLGNTTASGTSGSGPGLIRMARDPSTGAWWNGVLPLPTTTDCITLKTYTTRVLLLDSHGIPQGNQTLTAKVSSDCSLIINGQSTLVTMKDNLQVTTDASGYANFIHAVSSLATPKLMLTLPDGTQESIDPTGAVLSTLKGITDSSQLTNASYVDAQGNAQKLVPEGTHPTVVSGVVNGLQVITAKLPSLPTAADFQNAPARATLLQASSGGGSLFDLGDLVQNVIHVAEDISQVVFEAVGSAVHFVVTIAEDVFTAIVNTVEDALHAITALFKWIGAEFEKVFQWLGFLFDWSDFVAVKDLLKTVVNESFHSLGDVLSNLQSSGDKWFAHLKESILPNLQTMPMPPLSGSLQSSCSSVQPASLSVGSDNTDVRNDARLGWLRDRMNAAPSSSGPGSPAAPRAVPAEAGQPGDPIAAVVQAFETLVSDVSQAFKEVMADVGKLISGELSASDFFKSVLAALETLGVEAAQAVFDALMKALESIASSIQQAVNTPIELPILSPLYKQATGSELTLLDLICLVLGIGITLVYKIATNQSPVAVLSQRVTAGAVRQVFSGAIASQTPPLSAPMARSSLMMAAMAPARAAVLTEADPGEGPQEDQPGALFAITGALLILQALTIVAEGLGDLSEDSAMKNLSYTTDLTGRTIRGLLEIIDKGEPMEVGGALVYTESVFNALLLLFVCYELGHEGVESEVIETVALVDANASLVWGIWQFINIYGILSDGGKCPWARGCEAAIELMEAPQAGACLTKDVPAAGVLISLRMISAFGAGVARLV